MKFDIEDKISEYGKEPIFLLLYRNIILPILFIWTICNIILSHSFISPKKLMSLVVLIILIPLCYLLFQAGNKNAYISNLLLIGILFLYKTIHLLHLLFVGPNINYYRDHPREDMTGLNALALEWIHRIDIIGTISFLIFLIVCFGDFIYHKKLFLLRIEALHRDGKGDE